MGSISGIHFFSRRHELESVPAVRKNDLGIRYHEMRKPILVSALALMALPATAQLQTNAAGKTRIPDLRTMQKTAMPDKAGKMRAPAIEAPDAETYGNSFATQEEFETLLTINGNNDEKVWEFYAGVGYNFARCNYNSTLDMDDWLVTPGFELEAGHRYIISFKAFSSGSQYPEKIEALLGTDRTAEAMTIPVIEPTVVDWDEDGIKAVGAYFTPETSGTYYLGLHGISEPDKNWLAVTDIRVSSPDAEIVLPPETGTFECTFETQADFAQFLPVDCNEDGKTWKYVADQKWASCAFNSELNMDDWMISPAIELEGGRSYLIGFKAQCSDPKYPERLAVAIGTERSTEGMTTTLMEPTMITLADMQDYNVYFLSLIHI